MRVIDSDLSFVAPSGTAYYYNNITKQSTYTRPLPTGFAPSFPPPNLHPTLPHIGGVPGAVPPLMAPSLGAQQPVVEKKKKKEKPKEKIPIPGTNWTKVITTENNVFYAEKETKRSSWTVPEEIKEQVEAYESSVKAEKLKLEEQEKLEKEKKRLEEIKDRERIRLELENEKQQQIEDEKRKKREADKERERKRKEREGELSDGDQDSDRPSKVAKTGQDEADDEDDDEGAIGPVDEDDEEAWQKAVAEEIAKENAEKEKAKKEAKAERKAKEDDAKNKVFQAPVAVQLNPDEGKALFKVRPWRTHATPDEPR